MRRNVSAYGMPIVPVTNTGLNYNYILKLVEVSISISINGELLLTCGEQHISILYALFSMNTSENVS